MVKRSNLWASLVQAIKGVEEDYTQISLKRAIFLLAVPMILELVMESAFAAVDVYFVGKLGPSAIATVGLTETYLFILYSVGIGLSTAVTATVARRIGEGNPDKAGVAAVQSAFIGLIASIPFAIAGIGFAPELLSLMGADQWAIEYGVNYTRWMLGGNAIIMLLFILNAVYRGAGDAAMAMRVLWIANGINMVLDPLLIFGWGPIEGMGITGAAIATNIGRGVAVTIQLYTLFAGSQHIKLLRSHFQFKRKVLLGITKTAMGGIGQMLLAMTSWVFIMRILSNLGSHAVAGATIGLRLMMLTALPAWGLSNAAATLVGQNLGAGNPDRAEQSVWKIGYYNMIFLLLVSIIYYFANEELMQLFTSDPKVIKLGADWLKILSYGYFIHGWWMVTVQAFNGAGDTRTPTLINAVFFWMIQIPLAYLWALKWGWNEQGVYWAVLFSEVGIGLFTLWLFSRGKWKTHQI